jgi:molybdenum cofactor cytidylyltransferase
MGVCKSSLAWGDGETLLSYQVAQWLSLNFTPVVVLGLHNSHRVKDCVAGTVTVINPDAHSGKTTSILAGLKHIPANFEILAVSAVDQPRPLAIYQELVAAHQADLSLITVPTYHGKMGHPILFANEMRSHLANIREESLGLRQVIQNFYAVIHQVEFDDPAVLLDINTPEVYQQHK